MVRTYGPAKLPKSRYTPFQGGGPPPAPGGATAPMPTPHPRERVNINRQTVPIRREYIPSRPEPPPPPPPTPARKRKALIHGKQEGPVTLKPYRQPRGPGHKLPDEPAFVPFSGRAQRLPEDNQGSSTSGAAHLRANAIQRMRELGHQGEQARRGREMIDRRNDLGRAIRRGGARGDVVPLGKRKIGRSLGPLKGL